MKLTKKAILGVIVLASLATVGAQANTITGSIWENVNTVSPIIDLNGSLANAAILIGGRAPDVTFSVNSPISFDSRTGGYTIGGFLGSGGASILTGASQAGNTLNNTFFYFTGQVTINNGQTFNVVHDDGLQLMIGGIMVVDVPGPTPPTTTPYTWSGASGTYNFQLAYAENSGAPGVLDVQLPLSNVPDGGSTLALLGGAITMLGTVARRFRK